MKPGSAPIAEKLAHLHLSDASAAQAVITVVCRHISCAKSFWPGSFGFPGEIFDRERVDDDTRQWREALISQSARAQNVHKT